MVERALKRQKVVAKPTLKNVIFRILKNYFIFITILIVIFYIFLFQYTKSNEIKLVSFKGLPLANVEKSVRSTNVQLNVIRQYSSEVPKDIVIAQWPNEGSIIRDSKDRKITVYVSDGPEMITMPNVQNMPYNEAINILRNIQLKSSYDLQLQPPTRIPSEHIPEDYVISQAPLAGELITANTTISLIVSGGKEISYITLPDLTGLILEDAEAKLKQLGLECEKIQLYHRQKAANTIIRQEPIAGEKVKEKMIIKLYYNARPADLAQQQSRIFMFPYTTPNNYMEPRRIKMILEDNAGTKVVYDNIEPPEKFIMVKLNLTGQGRLKVYLDDQLLEIKSFE